MIRRDLEVLMAPLFTKVMTLAWPPLESQGVPGLPRASIIRLNFEGVQKRDIIKASWAAPMPASVRFVATAPFDDVVTLSALTDDPAAVLDVCPALVTVTVYHPGYNPD